MFRKHLTLFPWGKKTKLLRHDPNKSHMKNGLTYMTDVRGGGERAKKLIKLKQNASISVYVCGHSTSYSHRTNTRTLSISSIPLPLADSLRVTAWMISLVSLSVRCHTIAAPASLHRSTHSALTFCAGCSFPKLSPPPSCFA